MYIQDEKRWKRGSRIHLILLFTIDPIATNCSPQMRHSSKCLSLVPPGRPVPLLTHRTPYTPSEPIDRLQSTESVVSFFLTTEQTKHGSGSPASMSDC
jgi:hypothetical protein